MKTERIKPKRRHPATATCWNCGRKYDRVYKEHSGTWGRCNVCDSVQGIIAPSLNKKRVNDETIHFA